VFLQAEESDNDDKHDDHHTNTDADDNNDNRCFCTQNIVSIYIYREFRGGNFFETQCTSEQKQLSLKKPLNLKRHKII